MEKNIAFIDGQNIHLWTQSENWKIDFKKFRIYLKDKFKISEAYYFLWFISEDEDELYKKLQKAWFIVIFREHSSHLKWKKKGNVDVDIVFDIMKKLIEKEKFNKIVLASWDGDYIKLVKYLISKKIFKKILFPNKRYSSLYKQIKTEYRQNLSLMKHKIEHKKKRCS